MLKVNVWKKIPSSHKSVESWNGYILMKNIDFRAKSITWDKDSHFLIIKGLIHKKFITNLSICAHNNRVLKYMKRASLVEQRLRVCLPMQGTRVRAPVWEDPTCRRATRPVSHNY